MGKTAKTLLSNGQCLFFVPLTVLFVPVLETLQFFGKEQNQVIVNGTDRFILHAWFVPVPHA